MSDAQFDHIHSLGRVYIGGALAFTVGDPIPIATANLYGIPYQPGDVHEGTGPDPSSIELPLGDFTTDVELAAAVAVTKRATILLTGGGTAATTAGTVVDWANRAAICLPHTTTRWRLKARNLSPSDVAGSGAITCQGVWLGVPSFPATAAGRWLGALTVAPTQVATSFALSESADAASPWVTDPALQFVAGVIQAVSVGFTAAAGAVLRYDPSSPTPYAAGAGSAAAAGAAAFTLAAYLGIIDVRIEYECVVPADCPTVLVIGTSIEQGSLGGDTGPNIYETWPGAMALRTGAVVTNLGVASSTSTLWAAGGWRYGRADLATTVPDIAIIGGWTNDISALQATFESNYRTIIAALRALGIKQVWGGTIVPYPGGLEVNRRAKNAYVRALPSGLSGLIDFDKALALPATPRVVADGVTTSGSATVTSATAAFTSADVGAAIAGAGIPAGANITAVGSGTSVTISANATATATAVSLTISPRPQQADPDYIWTYPHPNRAGYQAMAQEVTFGRCP